MVKDFYHTGFVVADLDKSMAYYRDTMGLQLLRHGESESAPDRPSPLGFDHTHLKVAFLSLGNGHHLELIQYIDPESPEDGGFRPNDQGATHVAFFTKDVDGYVADMSQKGLTFPGTVNHRTDDNGKVVRKIVYSQDPDGNWLEFIEPVIQWEENPPPEGGPLAAFFHTGFVVKDLEESVKFYRDSMGLNLVRRVDNGPAQGLSSSGIQGAHLLAAFFSISPDHPGHQIELIQYLYPEGDDRHLDRHTLGATHLCFFVDDIDDFASSMSPKGLNFLTDPVTLERGDMVIKAAYARDPDGNWLEFIQHVSGTLPSSTS